MVVRMRVRKDASTRAPINDFLIEIQVDQW